MNLENFPSSKTAQEMMSYVTKGFYDDSYVGKWIFQVMGEELEDAKEKYYEIGLQIFPESATWGLSYHEIKYGLPVLENLSYEERRKRIIMLRDARASMSPWNMEKILNTLTGYEVAVNENIGHPNTFEVVFKNGDECLDFEAVRQKLMEIKQSHVEVLDIRKEMERVSRIYYGITHTTSKKINVVVKDDARENFVNAHFGIGHSVLKETTIEIRLEE